MGIKNLGEWEEVALGEGKLGQEGSKSLSDPNQAPAMVGRTQTAVGSSRRGSVWVQGKSRGKWQWEGVSGR